MNTVILNEIEQFTKKMRQSLMPKQLSINKFTIIYVCRKNLYLWNTFHYISNIMAIK